MEYDRITLGRLAKEQGFIRDTLEKVCRLTDINDWKNIPEEYWNMALEELKVPE